MATRLLITFLEINNDLVAAKSFSVPPSKANDPMVTRCKITLHFKGISLIPPIHNFIIITSDI